MAVQAQRVYMALDFNTGVFRQRLPSRLNGMPGQRPKDDYFKARNPEPPRQ